MKIAYTLATITGCGFIVAWIAVKYGSIDALGVIGASILLITAVVAIENYKSS